MKTALIEQLIFWCGAGHIALCAGSLMIPKALNWKYHLQHLQHLQPLLRQMFWTYAGYILVINLCFGIISIMGNNELINGSFLAKSVTLFITLYWMTRVLIQFFYFDRSQAPKGFIYTLGEIMLVGLFVLFSFVYLFAFLLNCQWI